MLRTGDDYLEGLRDGRSVYIDGELVDDVTAHPAFRDAARSIAGLYDFANDPANRSTMAIDDPESGDPINISFMIPRSEEDLVRRRKGIQAWSQQTLGLMGRSPDHVAGFLAGFAGNADVFARGGREYGDNVQRFHRFASANDLYVSYTIVPPQIDRSKPAHQQEDPYLYAGVKEERDDGIVIAGAQMLGTGSALSDWILLSNIVPLRPGDENYAISLAVPVGAPGVKVLSRRSYARAASSTFDYPLSSRFDETDSLVVYDDVFVPWEHVFVYRNLELVQAQWWETPAHLLGNNQAAIRLSTKLEFLVGLAQKITAMNDVATLPPVQSTLGELAALAAAVRSFVFASEQNHLIDKHGVARPGAEESFAGMVLQPEIYARMLGIVRELCGGGIIQLPSSVADFEDDEVASILERYVHSPGVPSRDRVKLLKLAWDLVGSEFASRHVQYETFYAGAPFVVKLRMSSSYDFRRGTALVESALGSYDLDGSVRALGATG